MFPSRDADGSTMYVGRWHWPGKMDFSKGMAFILYTAVEGYWELHLCPLTSPDLSDVFDYYKVQRRPASRNRNMNLYVQLEPRYERTNGQDRSHRKKFYIGKLEFNGVIDVGIETPGVVFLAFVADRGEEELQIDVIDPDKMKKRTPKPMRAVSGSEYRRSWDRQSPDDDQK
jgi:hypothetical protein